MVVYHENQSVLLQPCGQLDLEGGITLRQHLTKLTAKQHRLWVVDLTHVDFIDSAGLSALIAGFKLASQNQCRLVLCNPHPSVKLVLEITQLDRVLEVVNSNARTNGVSSTFNVQLSTTAQKAA